MKRWLPPLLVSLLSLVLPTPAAATAYTLPGNMPPGCTGSNGSYSCPALSLGYADTIALAAPKPATLTINGNFSTNNAQINQAGSSSDLSLIVNGTLTLGYQARIKANIAAGSVNDAGGGNVVITGDLTANGGNISLAYQTSVSGNLAASGSGTISTAQNGSIGGSVTGGSGSISIAESSTVAGDVSGSGAITVVQSATVSGDIVGAAGTVSVGYQARINGNISATGVINLAQGSRVGGTVTGGTGNVSVGYAATVVGALTTSSGTIGFAQNAVASSCVTSTAGASITLGYQSSINSVCCGASCTRSCVVNNSTYAVPPACTGSAVGSFAIAGTGSASTCTPQTLTIIARDASGNTLTGYTGTVNISTSTGSGIWTAGAGPAPSGTLLAPANNGQASYTFVAADAGIVRLRLAHSLAQNLTVTVVDGAVSGSSSTSGVLSYRDNAFVWTEDQNNRINGSFVAVAGRNHDMQVSLYKKDPVTGNCSIATDYNGSRNLKLWRTDNGGPWVAPGVVSPALTVPAARPAANNLTLSFTAGVAGFNLATSNVGKYAFSVDDDSLSAAATTVSGTSADLTVRPLTLAVTGLAMGGTGNPGGSAAADAVFGRAGAAFSATVTAYRWSSAADANDDGVPDAGVTLAQASAGGVATGFAASVALTPLAGSQTPLATAGGVLGTLGNNVVSSFAAGTATASNLVYSEVGSFVLNTSGVVGGYLGTAGLNLDALAFNASGAQQPRVGRFIPAGFSLGSASVMHRADRGCTSASTFTYLGENFQLGFTLTAQNAAGATTRNYIGDFARLDLGTATNLKLAGIAGSTMFKTANGRLALGSSSGNWDLGVASVTLTASATRTTTPDGPFDTASFGIAPVDLDGAAMLSLDLDTDSPANGADSVRVGTIPLRFGRLRLQNGTAPANRTLTLPLAAQYWNGSAYNTNTLDSCTRISASQLSFGNLRNVAAANAGTTGAVSTITSGLGAIVLAAPGSTGLAAYDVAIALDAATPPADASCLAWTPAKAATTGAALTALRGNWCGSSFKDPSARAVWGIYRGSDGVLYQRENY
ncbi:DUF6701 domain-containing protein [Roseateles sp.]|uniref:DUF6701 domain-containing protein n=1 Tax=Roseateles sp. TaxID=1971397 RepID=UPI0039E86713